MRIVFSMNAWEDYASWLNEDKKKNIQTNFEIDNTDKSVEELIEEIEKITGFK